MKVLFLIALVAAVANAVPVKYFKDDLHDTYYNRFDTVKYPYYKKFGMTMDKDYDYGMHKTYDYDTKKYDYDYDTKKYDYLHKKDLMDKKFMPYMDKYDYDYKYTKDMDKKFMPFMHKYDYDYDYKFMPYNNKFDYTLFTDFTDKDMDTTTYTTKFMPWWKKDMIMDKKYPFMHKFDYDYDYKYNKDLTMDKKFMPFMHKYDYDYKYNKDMTMDKKFMPFMHKYDYDYDYNMYNKDMDFKTTKYDYVLPLEYKDDIAMTKDTYYPYYYKYMTGKTY